MRKLKLLGAAIVVAWGVGSEAKESHAQGVHFGAGSVHVDIGNPHRGWYRGGGQLSHGPGQRHSVYNYGHWGSGHTWHDTSHYDYHPGGYVRHRNHYHYMPGHYDFHREGHWDHHHH